MRWGGSKSSIIQGNPGVLRRVLLRSLVPHIVSNGQGFPETRWWRQG